MADSEPVDTVPSSPAALRSTRWPSAPSPVPTASSLPTAGSTTPAPPGCGPTCSSAISTPSRAPGSPGRRRTSPSSATPPTRRRPTRSWRCPCAAAMHPERLVLVAGRGDRLDHAIAALGALGGDALADVPAVEGWWGRDHVLVARPGRSVRRGPRRPARRSRCSPCTARAAASSITGSRWPLADADLAPLVGLGVSNEVVEPPCRVDVAAGVVTVIIPGAQP